MAVKIVDPHDFVLWEDDPKCMFLGHAKAHVTQQNLNNRGQIFISSETP